MSQPICFKESLKIRHRITHPKNLNDLFFTDQEISTIREAENWFDGTNSANFEAATAALEESAKVLQAETKILENETKKLRAQTEELRARHERPMKVVSEGEVDSEQLPMRPE